MKAAVLHELGSLPIYETFPDPIPQQEDQLLISVKAASLKNLDKARASGKHYASYKQLPVVVGFDGVGVLEDGTRVYAQGITGMMAEKALIGSKTYTVLPPALSDVLAAALPNAAMGAALALKFRADIKQGDVVLINGATGVTGQLAVQLAKHYGASRVIATGRNQALLDKLKTLGADELISLKQDDQDIIDQVKHAHDQGLIDVVIDYLWGHPISLILKALVGGDIHRSSHKVRIVSVGSIAGEDITVSSGTLRSSAIELVGSGLGSFSPDVMRQFHSEVLPDLFQLAAEGKLTLETETASLDNIEAAWQQEVEAGKRLVICI